jgi:predicted dehydrogenase
MPLNRRRFLKSLAATPLISPFAISDGRRRILGANERLRLGVIGVAGRGGNNLASFRNEEIAALCDADAGRLRAASRRFPGAAGFVDWRELLEQDLDAIVISTPDHQHAPPTTRALAKKLPVYCEKPLTHTVAEARRVRELARAAGVATQMGTQHHECPAYLRAKEIIDAGMLGDITEVHVVTDRPGGWWPQGMPLPQDRPEAPRDMWWDLWLGPAPTRPFHPSLGHFVWRGWWDYGCGAVGDMAIHLMDLAVWALKLGDAPVKVSTRGSKLMPHSAPKAMTASFEFGKRGAMAPVTVSWYEGEAEVPEKIRAELPMNGSLFVGREGRMAVKHASREAPQLFPEGRWKGTKRPEESLPASPGHHRQWIDAIRKGTPTSSDFEYACPFTELVLLANASFRSGESFVWQPEGMKTGGSVKAQQFLSKSYRPGWELA